ncbi:MAG: carbohydrate ABC transporter permease [Mycobacterium leprae]
MIAPSPRAARQSPVARTHAMRRLKNDLAGFAFISPWLIGFLLLTLFPMLQSLWISFTNYDLLTPPTWAGLDNYRQMLTDPRLHKAIAVTLKYVVVSVPLKLAFALLIAMLLAQKIRGVGLYRVIYYVPSLIGASVAVAIMWRRLFSIDGAINQVLALVGIHGKEWIGSPTYALYTLAGLSAWTFGSSMVIFLAGLKQVPAELYEASAVDGANRWQQFWRITIPMLSPVIFFNLIMQTIGAFQVFTQGYLITQGGPLDETRFYALYLYEKAFRSFQMGYASAMAWVLLIMIAVTTAVLFRLTGRFVHYETDMAGR